MRHSATRALFERRDALIVASVSCIYGLGSPEAYHGMMLLLEKGMQIDRDAALRKLVEIQYRRINTDLERGSFRVRGDVLEIWPSYAEDALRVRILRRRGDGLDAHRHGARQGRRDPEAPSGLPELPLRDAARDDAARDRGASRSSWPLASTS